MNLKSHLLALAVTCVGVAPMNSMAVSVLFNTDFAGLTNGDLNGQTSTSTVGSSTMAWSPTGSNTLDVSSGQLTTTGGGTNFGLLDATTQTALNASNEVWFSIDMRTSNTSGTNRFGLATTQGDFNTTVTMGQRLGGLQTRLGPFVSAADLTSTAPGAVTSAGEALTTTGWTANTTFTLVGKLTINRAAGAAEIFQFWYIPQGSFDFDNPGTAYITMNGTDLIGASTQITGVVFNGNQSGLTYDNLMIAVPEPSVALLGGLGVLGLLRRRRN